MPLLLTSPPAFLSSLCISAPYTDIMALSIDRSNQPGVSNNRQTLEVLDVVPRMINESLSDPAQGPSDSNIVAVTQLLSGSLLSDYTALVPSHQTFIKHMIKQRGGLHKLQGWVLPVVVCITNIQACLMRDEDSDPDYVAYSAAYARENPRMRRLVPESPLFSRDACLQIVATSKKCSTPTLQLLMLLYRLTDKFVELGRLEDRERVAIGPRAPPGAVTAADVQSEIESLVISIHDMPHSRAHGHRAHNDSYYESIRLGALIYSHAIYHRVSFYEATTIECVIPHAGNCRATPEMVQRAVSRTNLSDAWDRMAGTLHWLLLVASAACHEPTSPEVSSPGESAVSDDSRQRKLVKQTNTNTSQARGAPHPPVRPQRRVIVPPSGEPPIISPSPEAFSLQFQEKEMADRSERLLQQYLSDHRANQGLTNDQTTLTSIDPPPIDTPHMTFTTHSGPRSPQPAVDVSRSTAPRQGTSQESKRPRASTAASSAASPPPLGEMARMTVSPTSEQAREERLYVRKYLVGNAVSTLR